MTTEYPVPGTEDRAPFHLFSYLYILIITLMSTESKYNKRGVSSQKEDVHAAIKNIDKGLYPKAFCKIVPDLLG